MFLLVARPLRRPKDTNDPVSCTLALHSCLPRCSQTCSSYISLRPQNRTFPVPRYNPDVLLSVGVTILFHPGAELCHHDIPALQEQVCILCMGP